MGPYFTLATKRTIPTVVILSSIVVTSLIIYTISLGLNKAKGTFTVITDSRKEKRVEMMTSYLGSHPWRHMTTVDAIRHVLRLDYLKQDGVVANGTKGEICPEIPKHLEGPISAQSDLHDFNTLESMYFEMHGGLEPKACQSRQKVAIIVPYRNRERHLSVLLYNLIPFLKRQLVDFIILVVNQALSSTFNRAILFNVGVKEASKIYPFDCFIFHDVDLLPLDDRNLYSCGQYPRHMSVAIDKFRFRPIGPEAFGGVTSLSREHVTQINGASNLFFGWGGEDDDLWRRIHASNLIVVRYPLAVSRYSMIQHGTDVRNGKNQRREKLLKSSVLRMHEDGLNTVTYKRLALQLTRLFLWIDVEVDEDEIWKNAPAYVKAIRHQPP